MSQAGWPLYKGVTAPDVLCDALIDKLKVLRYHSVHKIHRAFFVMELPGNARKYQYEFFMDVASWVISTPLRYTPPDPVEDPAQRCEHLLRITCDLGAMQPDWPYTELVPGYGEAVCVLLDCLANMALTTVQFGRPVHSADAGTDRAEAVNDVEQDIVGLADADGAVEEVEEEALGAAPAHGPGGGAREGPGFLTSRVQATEWKIELERVRTALGAAISTDVSDWRMRLRDMAAQHGALEELTPGVEQVMERTAREVKESLNRIQAREKELNHDVDDGARDFRQEQDELLTLKARYEQLKETLATADNELRSSSRRLEKLKEEINKRVDATGDLTPVAKAKEAIDRLRTEIKSMEARARRAGMGVSRARRRLQVRIGVVRSNLVNAAHRRGGVGAQG